MCRFGWALKSIYRKGWKGRARARLLSPHDATIANGKSTRGKFAAEPTEPAEERKSKRKAAFLGRSVGRSRYIPKLQLPSAALLYFAFRIAAVNPPGERAQRVSLWLVTWICRPQLRRS